METAPEQRPTRRQRQAQATRADILAAARRLFAERGYAHAGMTDIAREADVAVQTIYASVGSKRELVFALLDLIDEESDVPALVRTIAEAPDARQALTAHVHLTRQMQERVGDVIAALFSASVTDADAAAAAEDGLGRHRAGATTIVQRVSALGGLRDDIAIDEAAAIVSVLTSTAVYKQFRREFGWSFDDCERWVLQTLTGLLLAREP